MTAVKVGEREILGYACPRILAPRQVLDLHADLHRSLARPSPLMDAGLRAYAIEDARAGPWAASHLHPATRLDDLDPWVKSLGTDLAGATTYQVTGEMIDLAEALSITTPDLGDLVAEDMPSDWGFLWLDRPVPRPSVEDQPGQDPLLMHAVSWAIIPSMEIDIRVRPRGEGEPLNLEGPATDDEPFARVNVPAVRIREWGYNDDRDVEPRPLHLMGQSTAILTRNVHNPLPELHLVHMIWILMGMEIVASTPAHLDRAARKRAAGLARPSVRVITLRRPKHGEPAGQHRHVDWTCTWLVRGHWRNAPHGGTFSDGRHRTWIRPHIKGPDGLPLRSADILYKLAR